MSHIPYSICKQELPVPRALGLGALAPLFGLSLEEARGGPRRPLGAPKVRAARRFDAHVHAASAAAWRL